MRHKGGVSMETLAEIIKGISSIVVALSPILLLYAKRKNAPKRRSKSLHKREH